MSRHVQFHGVAWGWRAQSVNAATRPVNGVPTVVRISGYAINPDEYCTSIQSLVNSGLILTNLANSPSLGVLAHELGHMLISPEGYANALEHGVADTSNIMVPVNAPAAGTMNRSQ